jgi:hypothetical protein
MAEQTEKDEDREEDRQDEEQGGEDGGKEKPEYEAKAEEADNEMKDFEQQDELPSNLKDWPDGKAKYVTFDNEGEEAYGDGLTEKLGKPITHHDDGSVTVEGEGKVDNPDDYKGEPIPLALEAEDENFEVSGDRNKPGGDDSGDSEKSEESEQAESKSSS